MTLDTQNLGILSVLMIIYLPIYRKEYEQDESSLTEALSLFQVVFFWKPAVFQFLRAMEGGEETRGTLFWVAREPGEVVTSGKTPRPPVSKSSSLCKLGSDSRNPLGGNKNLADRQRLRFWIKKKPRSLSQPSDGPSLCQEYLRWRLIHENHSWRKSGFSKGKNQPQQAANTDIDAKWGGQAGYADFRPWEHEDM